MHFFYSIIIPFTGLCKIWISLNKSETEFLITLTSFHSVEMWIESTSSHIMLKWNLKEKGIRFEEIKIYSTQSHIGLNLKYFASGLLVKAKHSMKSRVFLSCKWNVTDCRKHFVIQFNVHIRIYQYCFLNIFISKALHFLWLKFNFKFCLLFSTVLPPLKLGLEWHRRTDGGVVRDEPVSFPPPAEQSSMDGGEVAGMSGFPSKQHLQGLKHTTYSAQAI